VALVKLKNLDEAEKELLVAAKSDRKDLCIAYYYLGGIYWGKREYKRAADQLERYLELAPNAPDAERIRGTIKELRSKK
jgi:tetratricopeptide (TPR) repeat protein